MQRALDLAQQEQGIRVVRASAIYETAPQGKLNQSDFLNGVLEVETSLSPQSLLAALLGIERSMGRVRNRRWGPRVIDLDVLLFGDARIDEPNLKVPHPHMYERAFVVAPLADLAPDRHAPSGESLSELAAALSASQLVRRSDVVLRMDWEGKH
jgi:2-amino-4-hydroxy-6-hydroxymethyldihydropteridine diphosphokinase